MIKKCNIFLPIFILITLLSQSVKANCLLFDKGKTKYKIVVSSDASTSEKAAAKELQGYISKIGGVVLPIVNVPTSSDPCIYVGANSPKVNDVSLKRYNDLDEGFTYKTNGENIYIYGGRKMGTAYGVFSFLEQQLGVHWFSNDYTYIPTYKSFVLQDVDHSEVPAFRSRHVLYYQFQQNFELNVHNKLNTHLGTMYDKGGSYSMLSSIWETHTFNLLVPEDTYFKKHPEYFSLRKGKRIKGGQLCLSNTNVLRTLKEAIIKVIKNNPGYFAYSISQNDNYNFCECTKCQEIEHKYGGHSGLLIWAINQIADYVKDIYPGVKICTFAYQYTRSAPENIRPRNNVMVRLCDIECCIAHPLNSSENSSFMTDLRNWCKMTESIYIWDYVTGFVEMMTPSPCLDAISEDIRMYDNMGVYGIMEEGQYISNGGEFAELKQWVLAKLLWNPYQNVDSLVDVFINHYYGNASKDIKTFYELYNSLIKSNTHYKCNITHDHEMFSDRFVNKSQQLLDNAYKKLEKDKALQLHVEDLRCGILFLKTMRNFASTYVNGDYRNLKEYLYKRSIRLSEGKSNEDVFKSLEYQ